MRALLRILGISVFCLPLLVVPFAGANQPSQVSAKIGNIVLQGVDGKDLPLHDLKGHKAIVVVFLSFDCPVSTGYLPLLNDLAKKCEAKQVHLLGICPTVDKAMTLAKSAKEYELAFPIFRDNELKAAKHFQAEAVPEAFLLDGDFALRYRGRIDDTYYARLKKKNQPPRQDLELALEEVLTGKPVSVTSTKAIGCPISVAKPQAVLTGKVTYYRDVLPILQNHCQTCHRPGEVGPFSLMNHEQAAKWADDIKTYTQSRQMPPWVVSQSLPFKNERKLTDAEIATLAAWADAGAPAGSPKDAPPLRKFADGWQLGEPDLVLEPEGEMTIGSDGRDLFRCFVLPTNFKEDKYVAAYELRPGNRKVVHHTLHFVDVLGRARKLQERAQAKAKKDAKDFGPGYTSMMGPGFFPPSGDLGGWAPGISAHGSPKGVGFYLPKGSDIIVQVHYHRTGRVEKDKTRLGLYFADEPVKPVQPLIVPGWITWIPAGKAKHPVSGSIWTAMDCTAYSITPHMHLLGKSIKVTMTPPGRSPVTLIRIEQWDYNWQETYFFKEPLKLKAGTKLTVEAVYDNSSGNPNNPFSPPRTVFPGEQTTNEMCFAFMDATTDNGGPIGARLSPNGFVIQNLGILPKQP
jgi:peroxiredoxin